MPHVAVDVGEDRVPAPGGHEETEGEGESEPVGWKEVGLSGLAERARRMWFVEAVDEDD